MASKGLEPLEVVTQQIGQQEAREESLEHELDALPRWRFRRRSDTQRQLERRRARRAGMEQLLERGDGRS